MASLSDRDATACAARIRDDFLAYNAEFGAITRRARARFEQRDWAGGQTDAVERIELYDRCVAASARELGDRLGDRRADRALWREIKARFGPLAERHPDGEFFKTYFSSITRRLFRTDGIDPEIEFVGVEVKPLRHVGQPAACRSYRNDGSLEQLFRALLDDYSWSVEHEDAARCAARLADELAAHYRQHQDRDTVLCVDVMEAVFYRDTRAYLVGRAVGWTHATPLVIAFEHGDRGVRVAAVIQTEKGVSTLFGFARSYFHVDLESVGAAILFLRQLLPRKPIAELFTVLGRAKQGKTERYRDFSLHLEHSRDRFVTAPGATGLVMLVFTLPSYDIVFKVIRDKFGYPKDTTREQVKRSYDLVFTRDKVGRLVDAQEFRRLEFHRDRFAPELLEELLTGCAQSVRLEGDDVVLDHVYVERRLRPLDLYLREADRAAARRAVVDYGQALRDLANNNIFPGDLLLKNFGVSRHGRVIFYDYDELCLLTDCRFRDIPAPRTPEDELSAEPWFHVGPDDVFPEEFGSFLGLDAELSAVFTAAHGDLLTATFWRDVQARIRAGEVLEVQPY